MSIEVEEQNFQKLKSLADEFIFSLHQLSGLFEDSIAAFSAYLKQFENTQRLIIGQFKTTIEKLDSSSMTYSNGNLDDPEAIISHECTHLELKKRLNKDGLNSCLIGNYCVIMTYEYWEKYRGKIAKLLNIQRKELTSDFFGDLRLLRHDIIHNLGVGSKEYTGSTKCLKWFKEGELIYFNREKLSEIFKFVFDELNRISTEHFSKILYDNYSLSQEGKARQLYIIQNEKIINHF